MILTDKMIKALVECENPLIENYTENNLQAASYDLTASNSIQTFVRVQQPIRLNSKESIAQSNKEYVMEYGYKIMPGEYILVKTKESIHLPKNLTAHVRPRTSFTRLGLLLSDQHINPTFHGHLYLGMLNVTPNTIEIMPELGIGQIVFEELDGDVTPELLYENKKNAKYQHEDSYIVADLREELNPELQRHYESWVKKIVGEKHD